MSAIARSAPPPDAPLILTLGDSSVFSHGVEDGRTLHDALQAQGKAAHLIGGAQEAGELDAKRAIDQAARLAARL